MVKTISKAKEDIKQNQIETLEKASKDWAVKNTDKLPEEDNSDMCYIKIGTLSLEGFIENKEVEDPETGIKQYFAQFGDMLPKEMADELAKLEANLKA